MAGNVVNEHSTSHQSAAADTKNQLLRQATRRKRY
jgi:hypothetical protein